MSASEMLDNFLSLDALWEFMTVCSLYLHTRKHTDVAMGHDSQCLVLYLAQRG